MPLSSSEILCALGDSLPRLTSASVVSKIGKLNSMKTAFFVFSSQLHFQPFTPPLFADMSEYEKLMLSSEIKLIYYFSQDIAVEPHGNTSPSIAQPSVLFHRLILFPRSPFCKRSSRCIVSRQREKVPLYGIENEKRRIV